MKEQGSKQQQQKEKLQRTKKDKYSQECDLKGADFPITVQFYKWTVE